MSKHEKEGKPSCLFARQDMNLINVKFFRGDSDIISEEEFNHERAASAERKRTGEIEASTHAPQCKKAPIDLKEFVANM